MRLSIYLLFCLVTLGVSTRCLPAAATSGPAVRLYALDCGRIDLKDMRIFSDTGEYDNVPGTMVDPCFLIRHPNGTLLWDTGLGDAMVGHPQVMDNNISFSVDVTLKSQLQSLGLETQDITFVAMSHFHFDHTGNVGQFKDSTWLLNKAELAAMTGPEPPFGVDPQRLSAYKSVPQKIIDGDYDVFGDGSVRILRAYGHTPGHQVLLVRLQKSGYVLLAGDLYHTRDNRAHRRVPSINTERADTLASIDRIEHIADNLHARLIIQHNPEDFRSLPKFPAYLE